MSVFLDSELSAEERDANRARFVVVPVPLERTVSYGSGTANGPSAIIEASNELERIVGIGSKHREPCLQGIETLSPIDCMGPLPAVMDRIADSTKAITSEGKIPVVLGGEHSLTFGAMMGVQAALGEPVGIVQIDAHADLRGSYQGEKHSHASVMHLLAQAGVRIAQFGVRALCREELESRKRNNVFAIDGEHLALSGAIEVALPDDFPEKVYVSFDVDGLDPAIMPATGTPVPGGLGYFQALNIVESALKGRTLIGFDVVELAPNGDPAWDFTAAQITYRLMASALI